MTPELLTRILRNRADRRACVLATRLPDGTPVLLEDHDFGFRPAGSETVPAALLAEATSLAAAGRSGTTTLEGADWFLHLHAPPPRLLIVGAVHIAQVLAPFAAGLGMLPVVIDPRTALATPERFPGVALRHEWPDDALRALRPDRHTAVVVLTHDSKLDDPALTEALNGPAFYVGALGSRRTHAKRRDRLHAAGLSDRALDRLRGPVGLAIGAIGAEEIALSIAAEIVATRRGSPLATRSES
ncbi:XdhC family protein [Rhizosaccharibacter radicis]|uniref:XdhC family protein n=1 Tax=Rhizosaccharibacter radicis TaxID=2782605 RepID=A0ABT1W1M7_9PROT|nr:XdhC family protein [Acetobacteraceae bacterium KSS12]